MRSARNFLQCTACCVLLSYCGLSSAQSAPNPLPVRPKIAESTSLGSLRVGRPAGFAGPVAPFVSGLGADPPLLLPLTPTRDAALPGSCGSAGDNLCYDYRQGRVVYKPARKLMPEIAGLKRESLSIKRDKVTLNYSFK